MNAPPNVDRRLQLEALETRTLLAGADLYGLETDFYTAMLAVSGTGEFQASFSTSFGNHQLVLTGSDDANLTIDLNALPDFVTNLKISSFDSVNFVGKDKVDILVLNDVGTFKATDLSVTGSLHATNVDSLTLASAGSMVVLKGSATKLTVDSLNETIIVSDLKSLTLLSESKSISLISLNDKQDVYLKYYLPDLIAVTGLPESSIHVLLPGTDTPTPDDPTPTPDDPTPTPDDGHTVDPGKLIIVSFPLDERTRAFLQELRAVLDASSGDADQIVSEYLAHRGQANSSVSPLIADDAGRYAASFHSDVDVTAWAGKMQLPLIAGLGLAGSDAQAIGTHPLGTDGQRFINESDLFPTQELPVPVNPATAMEVDVSWAGMITPAAVPYSDARQTKAEASDAVEEVSLADSVRALGNYLVERVTAEFSPGQQSIVLLVDPQPSRGFGNRKVTAERAELSAGLPAGVIQQI